MKIGIGCSTETTDDIIDASTGVRPQTYHLSADSGDTPVSVNILAQDARHTRIEIVVNEYTLSLADGVADEMVVTSPGLSAIAETGAPDLPQLIRAVQIPNLAGVSFEVVDYNERRVDNVSIAPSKGPLIISQDSSLVPRTKGRQYREDALYPEPLFELLTPYIMRNVRATKFRFNPFRYNPVSKEMVLTDRLVVDLLYEDPSKWDATALDDLNLKTSATPKSGIFSSLYPRLFANYDPTLFGSGGGRTADAYSINGDNMLIVTTSSYSGELADYIAWKTERGLNVEVNTTAAGSGHAAVKAAIQNKYDTDGLTYVVIIGDIDDVPSPLISVLSGKASDPSYVLLEGNDIVGDALISRISVNTVAELRNQLNKILIHEQALFSDDEWIFHGVAAACTGGPDRTAHATDIRNAMLNHPDYFHDAMRILENDSSPSAAIKTAIENFGTNIFSYIGHGSETGFASIPFDRTDAANLQDSNGRFPMIHAVSCQVGNFGRSSGDCFAEAMMKAGTVDHPTGPVAMQASTENMYVGHGDQAQYEAFTNMYYTNGEETYGALVYYSTLYAMNNLSDSYAEVLYRQWHLFGDCSTLIWKQEPSRIALSVAGDLTEGDGVVADAATVTIPNPAQSDIVLSLTSSDPSELTVPSSVILQTGETSVSFDLTVVDDTLLDASQNVDISLTSTAGNASASVVVHDNETATLAVSLQSDVEEGDGVLANHGTVSCSQPAAVDIAVTLSSDDTSEIVVPEVVTIQGGTSSVDFDVTVIDDIEFDGTQNVAVSAEVAGWTGGEDTISVADNETAPSPLTVTVPEYSLEGKVLDGAGEVSIPGALHDDLTVSLVSNDETELTVPASVTIPAGNTTQSFTITTIDDGINDNDQVVIVTASAPNWADGSDQMVVREANTIPYYQDFSNGLPSEIEGFSYYSSNGYGRIRVQSGELLMDSTSSGNSALNEALLTLNLAAFHGIQLNFSETDYADEETSLPLQFIGHLSGDGVAISNDDNTWYTIVNASDLAASGSFSVNLDDEVTRIRNDYDPSFGYTAAFKIKFQQYDNYPYSTDGRAFDNIEVIGESNIQLAIPETASEGDGVLIGQGSVILGGTSLVDREVLLSSSDVSEVIVPSSVTVPAGNSTAVFDITIVDDADLDGIQTATVAATYGGGTATDAINVSDNEVATLSVDIVPNSVTEGDGVVTGQAAVSADLVVSTDIVVTLSSDNLDEISVPGTVTLMSGTDTAAFDFTVIDDQRIDGTQTATVAASVTGWTSGQDSIDVEDNETTQLSISVPATVREGDGTLAAAGSVSISGTLEEDLLVTLTGDDPSELTIPSEIAILAGQTSATFDITVVDDTEFDGAQSVAIDCSAVGFTPAGDTITVADNDAHHFDISGIAGPQQPGVPFNTTILAKAADNMLISNYDGSVSLSAAGDSGGVAVSPTGITFSNGEWTGGVTAMTVDTNVSLTVDDGAGHTGTSNAFDVISGSVAGFEISAIGSPVFVGDPVDVTITAVDSNGYIANGFTDSVALRTESSSGGIKITEINRQTPDAIEFVNVSEVPVDLSGWHVDIFDYNSWPSALSSFTIPSGTTAQPGDIFVLEEYGSAPGVYPNFYYGYNIDWTSSSAYTAVLLRDDDDQVMDFFCVSCSSPSTVTPPVTVPSDEWTDPPGSSGGYYSRIGNSDNNDGDDWTTTSSASIGSMNAGLQVPFVDSATVAISPETTSSFTNGVWQGAVTLLDEGEGVILIADDGTGHTGRSNLFDIITPELTVSVPGSASEGDGVLTGAGTVTVATPVSSDVDVTLTSSDSSEVTVPSSVTILQGETDAVFDITIVDDAELDGSQTVTVTATLGSDLSAVATIEVEDDERPPTALTLNFDSAVFTEGDGVVVDAGSVSASTVVDADTVIDLVSDDTSEIIVPDTVTIPAGDSSVSFDVTVVDDTVIDGTQSITVEASRAGWISDSETLTVIDNEDNSISLSLPADAIEGDGILAAAGTVSISETLTQDLAVTILSSDESEVIAPADVTIPAGSSSVSFDIEVVDDSDFDGTQSVTITASAIGYLDGVGSLIVLDNDVHHLTISAVQTPQIVAEPFPMTVEAMDINDVKISTFAAATATLSAQGDSGPLSVSPDTIGPFVAGEWSGSIAVDGVDAGVELSVDAGAGVTGISNPFDVIAGPVNSFVISTVNSPMLVNDPFAVSITAMDANGYVATQFTGPAALSAIGLAAGAVSPSTITGFIDGVWGGEIAVTEAGESISLLVSDENSHQGQSNPFTVTENTLLVIVPETAREGDGSASVQGTVSIGEVIASDIAVTLTSSDALEAVVPGTIILPAGDTAVDFDIAIVDDSVFDGTQQVLITAGLTSGVLANDTIAVEDNEVVTLSLDVIPDNADEGAGVLVDQATLNVGVVVESDLAIAVTSSDTGEVDVPTTVTVPAGQDSTDFNLVVVDDQVVDGPVTVTITAAAEGQSVSDTIIILDNDNQISEFQVSTIANPQVAGVPIAVTLSAVNTSGEPVTDYNETVPLSAQGDSGALTVSPSSVTFISGQWTGSVVIADLDTQVSISVDDGNGHVGTSNLFDVTFGAVDHFDVSDITSSKEVDEPFEITVTAKDANGFTVTSFNQTVSIQGRQPDFQESSIVLTKIDLGTTNAVEVQNVSEETVDTTGWTIVVSDSEYDINIANAVSWSLPNQMASGERRYTTDFIWNQYFGADISWEQNQSGWVMLLDDEKQIKDFAVWGWAEADIADMDVVVGGDSIDLDDIFVGDGITSSGYGSIQRKGDRDSNSASDFVWRSPVGLGTENSALQTPFLAADVPIDPSVSGAFVGGTWQGTIRVLASAESMSIVVDDGNDHTGESNTFEVIDPVPTCNENVAFDIGSPGQDWTVQDNACLMVRDGYPSWWGVRNMSLQSMDGGTGYPVPFTWQNTCGAQSGSDVFTGDWQSKILRSINSACATVISLQGSGTGAIRIRYYAN